MLSFSMIFNRSKAQFYNTLFLGKIILLAICLMVFFNARATNFYVGAAYTPMHYSSWAWGGFAGEGTSTDTWYFAGAEVRAGIEQKLLHLDETDPEWGHADLGVGARVFASIVLTDQEYIGVREGSTNFSYGFEPYIYFTPSSQFGMKLYVGNGLAPDDLTQSVNSFFWGVAFPVNETNEFFFDMRFKDSRNSGLADWSANSASYTMGINFTF